MSAKQMEEFNKMMKVIDDIESNFDEMGIQYPRRCRSCTDHLKGNEIRFCTECKGIMDEELKQGNVYMGGNAKLGRHKKVWEEWE